MSFGGGGSGSGSINTDSDVVLSNPQTDQVLTYNSSNKWTNASSVQSVAGKTGAVTLSAGDVGLGNVNNTSDVNKPISTATQTALNSKVTALGTVRIWPADTTFPSSGVQEGDLFPYLGS